jgi:hypothetical protein
MHLSDDQVRVQGTPSYSVRAEIVDEHGRRHHVFLAVTPHELFERRAADPSPEGPAERLEAVIHGCGSQCVERRNVDSRYGRKCRKRRRWRSLVREQRW